MKMITVEVAASSATRGSRHGFTASDYARDAANEINARLMGAGVATNSADEPGAVQSAIRRAEREISECDGMFRDLLHIEQIEWDIEE